MRRYWPSGAPTALQRCILSRRRSGRVVDDIRGQPPRPIGGAKLLFRSRWQIAQAR